MENPIVIRYKWTVDELLAAQRLHLRHSPSRWLFRAMKICGIVAIPAGMGMILQIGSVRPGVYLVILGIFLLFIPSLMRRETTKHFAKRPDKDMELEWQITSERLVSKSAVSSAETVWSMVSRVIRTPAGFLFYPNDKMFHWFPAHAFRDGAEMERLAHIAQSRVQQYDNAA